MEPERKIEKWLRAFAKKRRDDAGEFTLHPATRRRLQSEVARRASKPRDGNFFARWFGTLRPGIIYATCVVVMIFMGAALLLPGLSKAKSRSQMAGTMSNLKQVGVATKEFAEENNQRLPQSLAEIQNVAGTNSLVDPSSGKPFVYVAGGRSVSSLRPDSVLAYSPEDERSRAVLFADGHVESVSRTRFAEITNRGLIQLAVADVPARREIVETPVLASKPIVSGSLTLGGVGGESKMSDYPAAAVAANGMNFDKAKIQSASEDRKKSAGDGIIVASGATEFFDGRAVQDNAAGPSLALSPPATTVATWSSPVKAESVATDSRKLDRDARQADFFTTKPGGATTQQFTHTGNKQATQNLFKNAIAATKIAPVLANFQFQQNGSAVAVVDEDGSVYNGYLVAASEGKMQNESVSKQAMPKAAPAQKIQTKNPQAGQDAEAPSENYFFRVSGTNRSLQQNVVFTGNMVVFANSAAASAQNVNSRFNRIGSGGGNASPAIEKNMSQQLGAFFNSRIAGTAIVNNTNQIEINALPVTP